MKSKVTIGRLKKFIESVERDNAGSPVKTDNIELTFEFLCASFFPTILKNIQEEMLKEYIRGFKDGEESNYE